MTTYHDRKDLYLPKKAEKLKTIVSSHIIVEATLKHQEKEDDRLFAMNERQIANAMNELQIQRDLYIHGHLIFSSFSISELVDMIID